MTFLEHMTNVARNYFVELLAQTQGNTTEAAKLAGINRQHLYTLLKKLDVTADPYRAPRTHKSLEQYKYIGQWLR
jgi:DNA-binding NtrC family response regulator